jgi:hypothetical protein
MLWGDRGLRSGAGKIEARYIRVINFPRKAKSHNFSCMKML